MLKKLSTFRAISLYRAEIYDDTLDNFMGKKVIHLLKGYIGHIIQALKSNIFFLINLYSY